MKHRIKSEAFQRAALNSERYRILGLIGLLAPFGVYALARAIAVGMVRLLFMQALILALAIAYEGLMLVIVRRALKRNTKIPRNIWLLNVLIETQLPTVVLFLLIKTGLMAPYQLLVGPTMLFYFLIIILSTLRLSPRLSVLTGALSAIGYLAVIFFVRRNYSGSDNVAMLPFVMYLVYMSLILTGGIVAAFVAGQIRLHVCAALREAELQSELERVNHDLDIARSIQQGLLPTLAPGLDHFEVAGWNQPADQTGGDYFDWQALPDGRLAISLGDATGHGIGPALVMASCRAYARASLLANGHQHDVLDRLNRLLAEDLPANRFVTFVVALLDPLTAHVEVLSAGHGPILWYRYATDTIDNLEAQGIPLGMMAGAKYGEAKQGPLEAGDTLALITDGFYEWMNPEDEEFGLARLENVIREARDCTPEEVIARLRSAVETFCRGTKQMDDLTAVILKRKTS